MLVIVQTTIIKLRMSFQSGLISDCFVKDYEPYIQRLDALLDRSRCGQAAEAEIEAALNGEAAHELRRLIDVETLRTHGAFFTSGKLADFALRPCLESISSDSLVYDPAMGAGDLLLYCSRGLPELSTPQRTLDLWKRCLVGSDLDAEFVKAARRRFLISANQRAGRSLSCSPDMAMPQLRVEDGLRSQLIGQASHIVLNPPFCMAPAPDACSWGSGSVNSAAIFMERCVKRASMGTRIVAILPEVLRTGARYKRWRRIIEENATCNRIQSFGLFDSWADVDVFTLDISVSQLKASADQWTWGVPEHGGTSICDYFDVSVGTVVDFRDPCVGKRYQYLTPKTVAPWARVSVVDNTRRYSGKRIKPPFVVVRRTSRPNDANRAVGSLVTTKSEVIVDNHFLVCIPKRNTIRQCRELLSVLKSQRTSDWLNDRIRCRHLTVTALREVPWGDA